MRAALIRIALVFALGAAPWSLLPAAAATHDEPWPTPSIGEPPTPRLLPQLRERADAGEVCARAAVGYMIASGIGAPASPREGRAAIADAAERGCARAHYLLARTDDGATGVEQRERAHAALRAGAALGDGHALNHLGTLTEIDGDAEQARALYRSARAAGNRAAAQNLLRLRRLAALPAEHEPIAALEQRARAGDAEAQYRVARRIHRGDGALIDYVAAWRWYQESARRGFEPAHQMMALLLSRPSADGEAIDWDRWFAKLALVDVPSDPLLRQRGLRQPIVDTDPFYGTR